MATRFDRVTTTTRPRVADVDLEVEELLQRSELAVSELRSQKLVPIQISKTVPRQMPLRALVGAMATWFSGVFLTCYIGVPLIFAILGINSGVLAAAPFALPAFAVAAFVTIMTATIAAPKVRLDTWGPRDPVLSATLGGLGVWAVVHNTSDLLRPFLTMGPLEFSSFFALNMLEMTLLGMMFASFTRSRAVAMAMGGGFQLLVLGLVLTLMSLAAI
jgi:hypothetical protein